MNYEENERYINQQFKLLKDKKLEINNVRNDIIKLLRDYEKDSNSAIVHTWQQDHYTSSAKSCDEERIKILKEAESNLKALMLTARQNDKLPMRELMSLSTIVERNLFQLKEAINLENKR